MDGLSLDGISKNETIRRQELRGVRGQNPFDSAGFKADNRISLDVTYMFDAPGERPITRKDVEALIPEVIEAHRMLENDQGDIMDNGIPMTGWRDLPFEIGPKHLAEIRAVTDDLSRQIDAFVSLGIGGSFLGIEATFRALTHSYFNQLSREQRGGAPEIYFLGQNMDPDYLRDTLDLLEGKRVGVNVISKSGTTTETAVAFRIIRKLMEETWGALAGEMTIVTTDKIKGALREMADRKGYRSFTIPDNIGGRYSVLSNVGLVGLAMANIDIEEFLAGFRSMREISSTDDFWHNPCLVHSALRYLAWRSGKKIEVIATNSAPLYPVTRWMEQLFPESEGHKGHGLWVSPALYSEKLHANGQMIQEGERNIVETFLFLLNHDNDIPVPAMEQDLDGLNFLSEKGRSMADINREILKGPAYAHYNGGVPNMTIEIPSRNAFNLGQLYYMMEKSVAVSGYLLGHNPFVQPGVEAYKQALFALIGRPGFEKEARSMEEKLNKLERIRI